MIVTKLDKFQKSVSKGRELVNDFLNINIKVNIFNIGVMDNMPASKLISNIFSFAECERDMIIETTKEGKAIAK